MMPQQPMVVPDEAVAAARELADHLGVRAPGVYTVGVGLKQRRGEFADELALFVYVRTKRSADQVPENELIPSEFGGFVTDVVEARPTLIDDTTRYDPLRGGIHISREYTLADGIFAPNPGTLGAIVRSRGDGSMHGLTCAHVARALGLRVYQPGATSITPPAADLIGTVSGLRSEYTPLFLDCATIGLDGSRGVSAMVEGLGAVRGAAIQLPALGEVVSKRGMRTGLTYGFVVRLIAAPGAPAVHQIEFSGAVPFVTLFAGKGDSGSVVLNASNQVLGLLFAIPDEDLGTGLGSRGLAMPIHHVQEGLQVDVAT